MTNEGMADKFKVPIIDWSMGKLNSEYAHKVECEMLSDVENPKKPIAILATDPETGRSYLSRQVNPKYCNNYLVIRNKITNAVRIFETDQYIMEPHCDVKRPESNSSVKKETDKLNLSDNLSNALGSKKAKRTIMEREKCIVKFDNARKKLKKSMPDRRLDEPEVRSVQRIDANILPPRNKAAKSIEDVYNVQEIMTPELLEGLEILADEIMECENEELAKDARFSKLFSRVLIQMSEKSVLKIKMLLFADSLVQFLNMSVRECRRLDIEPIFCRYSFILNEKLKEFCSLKNAVFSRPTSLCDKAVCYVLVLLFLINDFYVDISVLKECVKAKIYKKLPLLMKAVGARSMGGNNPEYFYLKFRPA